MDINITTPEIQVVSTTGISLWQSDDETHIKPKGGKKVKAEHLDLGTITENNYTNADKTKVNNLVTSGDGSKYLGDDGQYTAINTNRAISFYVDDTLTVDTKLCSVIAPFSMTIAEIRIAVDTAPTGADLIVDVNKNGITLYTTQANRPTITATNTSATATDPDVTSIAVGDKISIDVDQIGSTVAGENLMVTIICEV